MTTPYELLLSPFKIGNVTLKNRIMGSKCALQSFTLEQAREFYADMAKNGAATVTVAMGDHPERNLNLPDQDGRVPRMDGTGNDMRDPAYRCRGGGLPKHRQSRPRIRHPRLCLADGH